MMYIVIYTTHVVVTFRRVQKAVHVDQVKEIRTV
jgi:hypothetical protein